MLHIGKKSVISILSQVGARKIAAAENIIPITLTKDSTKKEYLIEFLNQINAGLSETVNLKFNSIFNVKFTIKTRGDYESFFGVIAHTFVLLHDWLRNHPLF